MEIKKISENVYEIPKHGKMNVPGRIFASEKLMDSIKQDKTLEQVKNVACLPGIVEASIALADAHQGYGFPIGGVAAFDMKKGVVSPGGVGYDISCSVRLLGTNLKKEDIEKNREKIIEAIYRKIPSGVGRGSGFSIGYKELDKLLEGGARYMVEKGYGIEEDCLHSEEEGCMKGADASKVSERAKKRGIGQIGTLGGGNHFLEIQYVDSIFDKKTAKVFGLEKDQVAVMIHCGSRGLGHQVASDYIKLMEEKYGYENIPDRELINAPIESPLGKDYLKAMAAAANFAFANKQLITYWVREELARLFPDKKIKVDVIYDVCHNIAKIEPYKIERKEVELCVHRKGATRAFGPGRKEIPKEYRSAGQPVLIPGSMGTSSYVLAGTKLSEEITFGSTVHGAGRLMSRARAKREITESQLKRELEKRNVAFKAGSVMGMLEEAPEAYKDVEEVVRVVDELGISKKVARLIPLAVVKG
ncbi:MAG: RtcB family protein [Candidatus Nanoarchaeia archaeon]|nr:RtcB family protein [Candidatus Nanoarchaeia archaeon]